MALIINHNLESMNALYYLNQNNNALQGALAHLSSGQRINSAADDAAGLAISQNMEAQINGLNQASQNAQDGISLIQTAEGALNETQSILQRMSQLAVQASNDTNTDQDRQAIQLEISQLQSEIDRISQTTQFNTKNLLDGSVANNAVIKGADALQLKSVSVTDANLASDTYTVTTANAATLGVNITQNTTGLTGSDFDLSSGKISGLDLGNYTLNVKQNSGGTYDLSLVDANGNTVASANGWDPSSSATVTLNGTQDGRATTFTIDTTASGDTPQTGSMSFNLNAKYAGAGDFSITNSAGGTTYSNAANLTITNSTFNAGGLQFHMTVDTALAKASDDVQVTNNALTLQIGANQNQTMKVQISKMDTTSLGVNNVDVSTQAGAEAAITAIDNAIQMVSDERANLGAYQNRLEHTINNLSTASQNLTSASSNITDVDMAQEMAEFTKDNVLTQAATAMLAQANQQPQLVLKLLG
jgi:flagellin